MDRCHSYYPKNNDKVTEAAYEQVSEILQVAKRKKERRCGFYKIDDAGAY